MANLMKNLTELDKFETLHEETVKCQANSDKELTAMVIFEYGNDTVRERKKVVIHTTTWEGGQVSLDEGEKINSDDLHCTFIPKFQNYKCTEEGFLVITDTSPKVGRYTATIIPIN